MNPVVDTSEKNTKHRTEKQNVMMTILPMLPLGK
jgi:hypothetical protein